MLKLLTEKWDEILEHVKFEYDVSDISFNTWLIPLQVFSVEDNLVTILVPDKNYIKYIEKKYATPLKVSIIEITGTPFDVRYVTEDDIRNIKRQQAKLNNVSSNAVHNNINPRYTFDTFVVGSNNKMAHAACLAVAESPAEMYNPLFIYGGVGLGKTHLMHSIANFVLDKNPDAKVLYVTSEKFTNDLVDAIRNKNDTTVFKEKYRNNDILLIDDIQFIIGKERTQEEFFHTFNELHESKKQIIISSDKPPKDIETLEERLRSRFEWGLTVDLQSPDYETRMAILCKKNELEGYNINNEVIEYIANNITSNIRELEGALNKIVAFSSLEKKVVTVELAEEALKDLISPNKIRQITPDLIMDIVAEHYNVSMSDLTSSRRNQNIVFPRQVVMYLCRNYTDKSLKEIGDYLGKKDHSTIISGCNKVEKEMENSENVRNTIEVLKKKINPS